jgi:hypothetical protein
LRSPYPGSPKTATPAGDFCKDFLSVANLLDVTFIKIVDKRDGLIGHTYQFELRSPWLPAESVRTFEVTRAQIQEYEKSEARDARLASLRKRKSFISVRGLFCISTVCVLALQKFGGSKLDLGSDLWLVALWLLFEKP